MLLSVASDARLIKVIVSAVIFVIGYLIVPAIRRSRENSETQRRVEEKLEGDERVLYDEQVLCEKRRRGKKFIWTSAILLIVYILAHIFVRYLVRTENYGLLRMLSYFIFCIRMAIIIFLVLGVVFLIKGRKKTKDDGRIPE